MTSVYVKPSLQGDGTPFLVRQPNRNWLPLPAEGAWAPLDEYWVRRIRDGDVVAAEPPPETDEGDGIEKAPIAMEIEPDGVARGELIEPPATESE